MDGGVFESASKGTGGPSKPIEGPFDTAHSYLFNTRAEAYSMTPKQRHERLGKCAKQAYAWATIGVLTHCRLPAHGSDMLELVRFVNIALEAYNQHLLSHVGLTEAARARQDPSTSVILRRTRDVLVGEDGLGDAASRN